MRLISKRRKTPVTPLWILVLIVFQSITAAQEKPLEQEEPIRVDVNLVSLRFTARDVAGAFVNTLEREDFRVIENGQLQELAYFDVPESKSSSVEKLWLAFLIDVSGSTFATRAEEVLAARAFFENVHDFTNVGIFGFTDTLLTFQDFTPDKQAALAAFSAAHSHLGKTAIYNSASQLISQLSQLAPASERKVIIIISDGLDSDYRLANQVITRARMSNVALYTIWVPSAAQLHISPTSSGIEEGKGAETQVKEESFARLSRATGGKHFGGFEAILDFDDVLAEINDEIFGNLYSIGYYTDYPYLEREERNILIEIDRSGVTAQGVFKNVPDRIDAKRRLIRALFDDQAISDLPGSFDVFHEIGIQLDLLRQRYDGEQASVPFRIKISPFSLRMDSSGDVRTQFGVIGLLTELEGGEVVRFREVFRVSLDDKELRDGRGAIYTNRVFAPPGSYILKLAILEIPSWRMTILERPLRIRRPERQMGDFP
jgi:VWFA-related protein